MSSTTNPNVTRIALLAAAIAMEIPRIYQKELEEGVFLEPILHRNNRKKIEAAKTKLLKPEAFSVLVLIWKESPFVTDDDLTAVGFQRAFENKELNKNSLCEALCEATGVTNISRFKAISTDIGRIVDFGYVFGLIEALDNSSGGISKPFRGSEKLHNFMSKIHAIIGVKMYTQLGDESLVSYVHDIKRTDRENDEKAG